MNKVKITKLFKSDKKKDGTAIVVNGKPAWRVAILTDKFGDKWYSALAFRQDDAVMSLKEGDEKTLIMWEQNGFLNFKLPGKIDFLEERVKNLEDVVRTLLPEQKKFVGTTDIEYPKNNLEDIPF